MLPLLLAVLKWPDPASDRTGQQRKMTVGPPSPVQKENKCQLIVSKVQHKQRALPALRWQLPDQELY
jgi:hypothetical protein